MQITKVVYRRNFHASEVDRYLMETIETEVTLNEGESANDAFDYAKVFVMEQGSKCMQDADHTHIQERIIKDEPLPEIQVEKELREATLAEQMMSCTEVKVLESYKFIAKKDPLLQLEYDKRMYILQHLNK